LRYLRRVRVLCGKHCGKRWYVTGTAANGVLQPEIIPMREANKYL